MGALPGFHQEARIPQALCLEALLGIRGQFNGPMDHHRSAQLRSL